MSPNEPKVLYLNIVGTSIVFVARSVLPRVLVHVLDAVFFFNLPAQFCAFCNLPYFCALPFLPVQDVTEAVEERVKQRLNKSFMAVVANRAARAASGIASPPMVASMLGEKIPQKMIEKMEEKGITMTMEEVFREGPYVVFQIQVIKVNAVLLANSKKSKAKEDLAESSSGGFFEMGSFVGFGLGLIGSNNQQWVEEGYLPKLVQKKLESAMGEVLADKLERKKMLVDTFVLGEAKQARFFFAKYREIQSLKPGGFPNRKRRSGNKTGNNNNNSSNSSQVAPSLAMRRNTSSLTAEKDDASAAETVT